MRIRNLISGLLIAALTSSQVAFAMASSTGIAPITSPITAPVTTPTPTPTPTPIPGAPTMVYPQNGATIALEGPYSFKVNPVAGATGYLFGFFQNGKAIFENYANLRTLSPNGEFVIPENMKGHELFKAGKVDVWVRALVNNKWTDARVITVTLVPTTPAPTATPSASPTPVPATPSPSPTPLPIPVNWTAVNLAAQNLSSLTPNGKGTVTVTVTSKTPSGAGTVVKGNISGSFTNLLPNTLYTVWFVEKDFLGYDPIRSASMMSDSTGNIYFFGGVDFEIYHRNDQPIFAINLAKRSLDTSAGACSKYDPCVSGLLTLPSPDATSSISVASISNSILSGAINYRMVTTIKFLKYAYTFQSVVPASGVRIEATNNKTGEKVLGFTNLIGAYSINVKHGQYQIKVSDAKKTSFNPAIKTVDVISNTSKVSFEGVLQTLRFW